jgi:hypothetical protein
MRLVERRERDRGASSLFQQRLAMHSEGQARRAAKRVGLVARKLRWRRDSIDNYGQFQLVDPSFGNIVVEGERYNISADDVVAFCNAMEKKFRS